MRGQIYFIRGNVRIQVVTDEKVYFFIIDKETFEPTLENVMYNYMQCSVMMFGARVRFGITYKTNQPGFQVYTRKFFHNFKVAISNNNYEGAKGCNLPSMGAYIMSEKQKVGIYDQKDFQLIQSWNVPSTGTKEIEILYMTVSKDENKIGIALGKHIIKEQYKLLEIVVYSKNRDGRFDIEKLRDFEFHDACITF